MEGMSDFVAIAHRKSGLYIDVRPAREGQVFTEGGSVSVSL